MLALSLSSCDLNDSLTNSQKRLIKEGWVIIPMEWQGEPTVSLIVRIVEIDRCEYLVTDYDRGYSLAHKGNCKFCEERMNENSSGR